MQRISLQTGEESSSVPEGPLRYETGTLKICPSLSVSQGGYRDQEGRAGVYLKDKCQQFN